MKNELPYFYVDSAYGGWQEWFLEEMMRLGGCGAVTACDCSIYFTLYKNMKNLYPFDITNITKKDYIRFGGIMKPYLSPRWTGIDRLNIYIDGFSNYLNDYGEKRISLIPFDGENPFRAATDVVKKQIDSGWPIPSLTLKHMDPSFEDYVWHWYLLTGYEENENRFMVKVVTYGSWRWLDFKSLWNTGYALKGGLILFADN